MAATLGSAAATTSTPAPHHRCVLPRIASFTGSARQAGGRLGVWVGRHVRTTNVGGAQRNSARAREFSSNDSPKRGVQRERSGFGVRVSTRTCSTWGRRLGPTAPGSDASYPHAHCVSLSVVARRGMRRVAVGPVRVGGAGGHLDIPSRIGGTDADADQSSREGPDGQPGALNPQT